MFSNLYKNEMMKRFNLTESLINSSIHYKIPKFVYKERNNIDNQCQYHHPSNSLFKFQLQSHPDLLIEKPNQFNKLFTTQYSEEKKKNILKLLSKVQREKIDLLINRAYHQMNNSIRKYNKSVSLPKKKQKLKLQSIPLIKKEFIIDHVIGQVQKYLPYQNKKMTNGLEVVSNEINERNNDKNKLKLNKQFIWSHNFMEEKKMEDYKRRYRIRYINTEYKNKYKKLKKEKVLIDKDIPEIKKIKTNMFFAFPKNKSYSLDKNPNNLLNIYNRTNYANIQIKKNNYFS